MPFSLEPNTVPSDRWGTQISLRPMRFNVLRVSQTVVRDGTTGSPRRSAGGLENHCMWIRPALTYNSKQKL